MADVFGQGVVVAQAALERDELRSRVLLVRQEDQTGIELTCGRIDAVGVAIPPAQDPQPAVVLRRGEPDVRVIGDDGLAVARRAKVGDVELGDPGERRANGLSSW